MLEKKRWRELILTLKQSPFFKNLLIVMSGTAIAQMISYAISPIISRLFSPSDFGIFGSFSALVSIVGALITLDYSQAIMLPKEKVEALNLFCLSISSTTLITLLIITISLIKPSIVYSLTKTTGVWPIIFLILSLMVVGINQSCQAWAVREKAFRRTSASQVIRSLSSSSARIIFGLFKTGSLGLIISNLIADLAATLTLIKVVLKDLLINNSSISLKKMRLMAREYLDFPLYSATQNFINAISSGLPVLLLTRFYGLTIAGSYAFGVNLLIAPMGLILTALRQVLFQKACEYQHQEKGLFLLYIRTILILFSLIFFPALIILLWGPQIFTFIFGARWLMAGIMAKSLIIWLAFAFCNLPAVLFARIIRIQKFVFFYDLALLFIRTSILVIGGLLLKVTHTIMIFATAGAIMNLFLIFYVGKALYKKELINQRITWDSLFNS